jgi:hypothetical protein
MFSNGAEVAWVVPPRLLEVVRTDDVKSLPRLLDALGPAVLVPAEAAQGTNGGGNPRVGDAFDDAEPPAVAGAGRGVVFTESAAWRATVADALAARGVECVSGPERPATGFASAAEQLDAVARQGGPIDVVVVALAGTATPRATGAPAWEQALDEHSGITDQIRTDAAWVRAVADHAAATERPMRVVTIVDATTAGGKSRAQAATQLSRAAHGATADRVDAFALAVETAEDSARPSVAALTAYLASSGDAGALSGAELVVDSEWFGLRTHPCPAGSISFGGPAVPDWLDDALRDMVVGRSPR